MSIEIEQKNVQELDVTTSVFVCKPPRTILHEDGSLSLVLGETIDETTHESVPVALCRTEHGYGNGTEADFNKNYVDETYYQPRTRISALVLGKVTREMIVPEKPKRTYEKRIRKAQKAMGQTLLATMQLTD
jgi:hypothetical protein